MKKQSNFKNPYFLIELLLIICACTYFFTITFMIIFELNEIKASHNKFNKYSKCPLCYGKSLCNEIMHNDENLKLKSDYLIDNTYIFNNLINIKNVYFATYKYSHQVVIKKLAHDDELDIFDNNEQLCMNKGSLNCILKIVYSNRQLEYLSPYIFGPRMLDIEVATCFSDRIVKMIYKKYKENMPQDRVFTNTALITTLKVNPEPVVLQVTGYNEC